MMAKQKFNIERMIIISKRILAAITCLMLIASMTSCSSKEDSSSIVENKSTNYIDLQLGKDYTDLNTTLTVLTHRTDLIQDTDLDTELPDYAKKFNELYPNITIVYEGVTDYDFDVKNRLNSGNYGDVLNIPGDLTNTELSKYFEAFDTVDKLDDIYNFVDTKSYEGTVYGIPSGGNAQGIVYNKKVFEQAGITELPKTQDEFIADLKLIKEKTNAIPLYTNYTAEWALLNWDFDAFGSTTSNDNYKNEFMTKSSTPFSKQSDNTGFYECYDILYRSISEGLIEDDPTKTSWEQSKERMNKGEIATMVLGSWAISQIQGAGDNTNDIDYMPFPITVDGKQYALSGSDYCYGINKNISDDKKIAAKLYIKFMAEKSNYSYNNSSIPTLKDGMYPEVFSNFTNVELLTEQLNSEEFDKINKASGLQIGVEPKHIVDFVDRTLKGEKFDSIMNDWNKKWEEAMLK